MAGSDSQRLMLKVCHQAYRRHLSHTEIAANLGISRFQVARLLRAALDAGYVSVHILEPERWHSELESQLEERLGLRAVIVVDGEEVDEAELQSRVADAAGRFLLRAAAGRRGDRHLARRDGPAAGGAASPRASRPRPRWSS